MGRDQGLFANRPGKSAKNIYRTKGPSKMVETMEHVTSLSSLLVFWLTQLPFRMVCCFVSVMIAAGERTVDAPWWRARDPGQVYALGVARNVDQLHKTELLFDVYGELKQEALRAVFPFLKRTTAARLMLTDRYLSTHNKEQTASRRGHFKRVGKSYFRILLCTHV